MNRKKKTKADKQVEDLFLIVMGITGVVLILYSAFVSSSTITQEFKNPSFNGVATSAHYLTIDEQETKRRDELAEKVQTALEEVQREIENSTLNKFLSNLQSRIFSNLSRDISDMLFDGENGGSGGTIDLEGNQISFANDGTSITLTVIAEDGSITEIVIPIGVFGVCTADCGT
jgi:hypothetical protein|tara:strand:- start:3338 stop:3859 length:522 start_codon:yes stop_codon:yes gene_type:complete